jgi:predicted enzyme related to lactoylglutathione lyase
MSNMPKMGEFCWTELATTNVQSSKDFYGKVFGWTFSDHNMGDMTYTMIKRNGDEFGGIWAIPQDKEKQCPPHWLSYILVENIEASLKKACDNGATVVKPVANAGDMGRFAVITDPIGVHFALWQSLSK